MNQGNRRLAFLPAGNRCNFRAFMAEKNFYQFQCRIAGSTQDGNSGHVQLILITRGRNAVPKLPFFAA